MLSEMNVQENHGTYCTGKPALKCCGGRKKVKGRHTSKRIGSEFPELEEFLWEIALWVDGYFAETIGQVNEEGIRK